ncbi:hypothetical protein Baya_6960 [Bagarius yarrelli]|uniref:Uncharacterized protein n=1 Tax=Bagarius yarrelli TaxID=175774 RepID=A0A556U3D9_BAGYA|nr:hypothetical protein Baya_6960 [Bagarius yarrelli]
MVAIIKADGPVECGVGENSGGHVEQSIRNNVAVVNVSEALLSCEDYEVEMSMWIIALVSFPVFLFVPLPKIYPCFDNNK